jgi:hypothetical protein
VAVAVTAVMMWWLGRSHPRVVMGKTLAVTWRLPASSPSAVVLVDRGMGRDVPALIVLIPRSSPALRPPQLLVLLLVLTRPRSSSSPARVRSRLPALAILRLCPQSRVLVRAHGHSVPLLVPNIIISIISSN